MFKEYEKLKSELEKANIADEDLYEWRQHGVTKHVLKKLKLDLLEYLEGATELPTCESARLHKAVTVGKADQLKDIINFIEE